MDSLDHQNIVRLHLQEIPFVFPFSQFEIKPWQFHPLALKQRIHIAVEKFHIDSFQTLVIVVPVFIPRRIFPVYKIIIHRDRMRFHPVSRQLDGQAMRKCGFS